MVTEWHAPDLRTLRVVDRHWLARDGRNLARVGVAREIEHGRTARAELDRAFATRRLAPSGAVVEHKLGAPEPRGGLIGLLRELAPGRAVLGDELGESDDRVA